LRLLDSTVLQKDLKIAGLSILRKITEMENKNDDRPSADWASEDWVDFRKIIQAK